MFENIIKKTSLITIIEHTKESPYKLTKILKSGIKELYHVITEWKTEHVSHRMMRPIEIIEIYPLTGNDLPFEKEENKLKQN